MAKLRVTKILRVVIAEAKLSCGCYIRIIRRSKGQSERFPVYVCDNWKRHKYELAEIERELAKQVTKMKRDFIR